MVIPRRHRAESPHAAHGPFRSPYRRFALDGLAGACIADILFAWNERCGSWLANGPVIVRLETCDLAVAQMHSDRPSLLVGSVDTEAPLNGRWFPQAVRIPESSTIAWKSYRPLSRLIGARVDRISVTANDQERELSIRFSLESGEILQLSDLDGRVIVETATSPRAA